MVQFIALGPAYNEYPALSSRYLCIKIIDCNVKKFSRNEHPLVTKALLHRFTRCKYPVYIEKKSSKHQVLIREKSAVKKAFLSVQGYRGIGKTNPMFIFHKGKQREITLKICFTRAIYLKYREI